MYNVDENVIDDFLEEISNSHEDEELLYPTNLKNAIIGTMEFFDNSNGVIERLVLDKNKCIEILVKEIIESGITDEDEAHEMALEHFYYNVLGSYIDGVPAYVTLID